MKGVSDDALNSLCKQYDQGKWEANSEKFKSTLKIVSRVTNTITLPPRLAVLRYSFWSSRDSRLLLTRGKSPQRALDIQEHLVVVLVIVSLYGFWEKKKKGQFAVSLTNTRLTVGMDLLRSCFVM